MHVHMRILKALFFSKYVHTDDFDACLQTFVYIIYAYDYMIYR